MGCGCGTTKEKLQTDILVLQLEKAEIQEERERLMYQLHLINKKMGKTLSQSSTNFSSFSRKKQIRSTTESTEWYKYI